MSEGRNIKRKWVCQQFHLALAGMCPQLSLQVMMGTGTPTAWQVSITTVPRAASTDSSGGLVTEGGAAEKTEMLFLRGEFADPGKLVKIR